MTAQITLQQYERAELAMERESARIGVLVHGVITILVSIGLVLVNVLLAPQFPWSAFAVAGMSLGFAAHWWFGYHKLEQQVAAKQRSVEARAATLR
jgi:hypothetical protein